jgi:hypothetical protein
MDFPYFSLTRFLADMNMYMYILLLVEFYMNFLGEREENRLNCFMSSKYLKLHQWFSEIILCYLTFYTLYTHLLKQQGNIMRRTLSDRSNQQRFSRQIIPHDTVPLRKQDLNATKSSKVTASICR